jgi:hypothetical protein
MKNDERKTASERKSFLIKGKKGKEKKMKCEKSLKDG